MCGQRDAPRLWSRIHSVHKNENSRHVASADSYVLWERWTFTSEYGHRITFPITVEIQFTKGQRDRRVLIEMKGDSKSNLGKFWWSIELRIFWKLLFIRSFTIIKLTKIVSADIVYGGNLWDWNFRSIIYIKKHTHVY